MKRLVLGLALSILGNQAIGQTACVYSHGGGGCGSITGATISSIVYSGSSSCPYDSALTKAIRFQLKDRLIDKPYKTMSESELKTIEVDIKLLRGWSDIYNMETCRGYAYRQELSSIEEQIKARRADIATDKVMKAIIPTLFPLPERE